MSEKYAKDFGKKERVLNYAGNNWQLTRPSKVGRVMALIRECQPKTFDQWENWYFQNAFSETKEPVKVTKDILTELGQRLFAKITEIVIPEWTEAFRNITEQDCIEYIYQLTIHRTYDGYINEKSIITDNLEKIFPDVIFEESDPELDHAGDIDFIGRVENKAFGIQIKPVTNRANFGNYKPSERMKQNFDKFEQDYGGKVFIVYSLEKEIADQEIIKEIQAEITRLKD